MTSYTEVCEQLRQEPRSWAVTGAAGFIGSNLLEALLRLDQRVVGVDNLCLGKRRNLEEACFSLTPEQRSRFRFIEGDVRHPPTCEDACRGVDFVLHQAALGSVPRSIENPLASHESNLTGHLNMLLAARAAGVRRFVYASSSSVYGDSPALPKREPSLGRSLSPYAVTKLAGELYSDVVARVYGLETVGLRYFNVFGRRQDPEGAYAAVIPKWVAAMVKGEPVYINGTGETSRDFCYVENVVQMNLLAATTANRDAVNQVYNVAVNARTTLKELFEVLRTRLLASCPHLETATPIYRDFRAGDVMHSQADISKAERLLGYRPTHTLEEGLDESLARMVAGLESTPCGVQT
jgi:UDP-N-acetylglucosamine 4-epimerase